MSWMGPPAAWPDEGKCDGDCSACSRDCEERGAECADPDNCQNCPAKHRCSSAIIDNDEE